MTDQPGEIEPDADNLAPGVVWVYGEAKLREAIDLFVAGAPPDAAAAIRNTLIEFHGSDAMAALKMRF